ncbi:recombination mediator RecR [Patescibacteria group bacterium]|nr:recombination mediator RecR [Patescibacteria group bacterium]
MMEMLNFKNNSMDSTISQLAQCFENLPGIGPRQARRFVYALLKKNDKFISDFTKLMLDIKKELIKCETCQCFFKNNKQNKNCKICRNPQRDKGVLLVVEKDIDLNNIESANSYNGLYYVLGGLVPPIGAKLPEEVRMKELFEKVKQMTMSKNLKEIILAFSATKEGENTEQYIKSILEPIVQKYPFKISLLGRGLSTGTELEYADRDTLKNALRRRD